jgi:adenylate cyclase
VTGHFSLGSTLFHLGALESSRQNFEKALSLYQPSQHRAYMRVLGLDPGVFSLSYLGHVLWLQGEPDRALENTNRALSLAEALEDPFSQAIALDYAAIHYLFRREAATAREKAESALKLCRQHGFAYYLAWATVMSGWAMTALSGMTEMTGMTGAARSEEGIATMRHGLELLRSACAELRRPFYLSLLAQAGEPGCLEEALSLVSEERDVWVAAELHRLQAESLREGQEREAEARYLRALDIARGQGARAFELRAAVGVARLWSSQGRLDEARTLLRGASGPAADASDTVDSREARSLLEDLSASAP